MVAEGLNLGLRKIAEACNSHDYWRLSRLAHWHIESETIQQALANVVAAQGALPMARVGGDHCISRWAALPGSAAGRGNEHGQRPLRQ